MNKLQQIWKEEMKVQPIIAIGDSVIYLQPSEDGTSIEYGSISNCGILVDGKQDYDFDLSLDVNIQGLVDMFYETGYIKYESEE